MQDGDEIISEIAEIVQSMSLNFEKTNKKLDTILRKIKNKKKETNN